MTQNDYLNRHLPHRINLLITFRERFSDPKIDKSYYRDFYICSKDISILMIRFFLNELGVTLKKGTEQLKEVSESNFCEKLELHEIVSSPQYADIISVLKAANRAVAHIDEIDVNHDIVTDQDNAKLINAINFTEKLIIDKIYKSSIAFNRAMSITDNNMERHKLLMKKI
jgi:hypothetical protein